MTIQRVHTPQGQLDGRFSAAGDSFRLSFEGGVSLTQPMRVEVAAAAAPTHPQVAEVAEWVDGEWRRANANFFRSTESRVIALTRNTTTIRPVLRTLQRTSGEAVERGRETFLHETFGNEAFFGGALGLHTLLNELTPAQAVAAGVQIDLDRVPAGIAAVLTGDDLAAKDAALQNPAITRALLRADAVVGVRTLYDSPQTDIASAAGITCALCHVSVQPTTFTLSGGPTPLPIGPLRLDGVPNLQMDAGAILALTPFAADDPNLQALLRSWGPGRFDVRALPGNPLDDGVNNPTITPPLWNFVDLGEQGYLYNWDGLFKNGPAGNALASQAEAVYDLVMHANGAFGTPAGSIPPELSITPPQALLDLLAQAEAAQPGNDIPAQALLDVQAFQQSIVSPAPQGGVDVSLAERGFLLFNGKASCAACHSSAEFTGPVLSSRITLAPPQGGLADGIKTPGLRGVARTAPYFHDGSARTLREVMDIYAGRITPALTDEEKEAVVAYMKTL